MDGDGAAMLSYSTPRVIFDRPYRYRSWNGALGGIAALVMGGVCVAMAWQMPRQPLPFAIGRTVLACAAAASALGFGWQCYKFCSDAFDVTRITDEGIEVKRRLYPWEAISTVYGTKVAGGIMVQFELRRTVPLIPKQLMTTPFLSPGEFEHLIDTLAAQVLPSHPHVKLDPVPRTSG